MEATKEAILKTKVIMAGYNSLTDFTMKTKFLGKNAFYERLKNPDSFKVSELKKLKNLLNLTANDVMTIFFD